MRPLKSEIIFGPSNLNATPKNPSIMELQVQLNNLERKVSGLTKEKAPKVLNEKKTYDNENNENKSNRNEKEGIKKKLIKKRIPFMEKGVKETNIIINEKAKKRKDHRSKSNERNVNKKKGIDGKESVGSLSNRIQKNPKLSGRLVNKKHK